MTWIVVGGSCEAILRRRVRVSAALTYSRWPGEPVSSSLATCIYGTCTSLPKIRLLGLQSSDKSHLGRDFGALVALLLLTRRYNSVVEVPK